MRIRILYLLFVFFSIFLTSCRDYEYIPFQPPGTRQILIFSSDSLAINKDTAGNYVNQDYYENTNNFMDSIRVDFAGATNIDTNNFSSIVVQANDEITNNIIKNYTFNTPDTINRNYSIGFNLRGISSFIVYFNLNLIISHIQSQGVYLRMKNIKVYNIF